MAASSSNTSPKPLALESPAFAKVFNQILPSLSRSAEDERPIVVMTCGIAGSGKSTLAKTIIAKLPDFTRFSVDKFIHDKYGLYGIDYARERYEAHKDEAQAQIKTDLAALVRDGTRGDAVLDLSFWNREYRDEYKTLIEAAGGRWVLVFLDADRELLWSRIQDRRAARDGIPVESGARDGDSALDIEPEMFDMYWSGFEPPSGEGEIRIPVQ